MRTKIFFFKERTSVTAHMSQREFSQVYCTHATEQPQIRQLTRFPCKCLLDSVAVTVSCV